MEEMKKKRHLRSNDPRQEKTKSNPASKRFQRNWKKTYPGLKDLKSQDRKVLSNNARRTSISEIVIV